MADTPSDPSSAAPEVPSAEPVTAAEPVAAGSAPATSATNPQAAATPDAAAAEVPPAEPQPVEIPAALQACVAKIHETIQNDLDDRELVKVLKKHTRKLKEWDQWSEHARNAYAHLIAAEIIHSKAASICIDNGIEFEDKGRSEYEHLLRAVQKRTPR